MNFYNVTFFILFVFQLINISYAESNSTETQIKNIFKKFSDGNYQETLDLIKELESNQKVHAQNEKNIIGIIEYWKAITYSRMNEYPLSLNHFESSIKLKYIPKDLYYEYGQALYVSEKLLEARIAFKKSVQKNYKKGVSLYYIAFISQTLKDFNKASNYYHEIEKLPVEEKSDVIQAARMQMGDIYWDKVKQRPNVYSAITKYVIPQYENALAWDDESTMAPTIKQKIEDLQRKYDIELFQMRNGRNTARPPYFLKVNMLYGNNDNINLLDSSSIESSTEDVGANYQSIGFFGRYTFYPNSSFSIAPELVINTTKYVSDSETIFANDNYSIKTALKINYEKTYNNAPATTYFDISYTTSSDDADADKKLESNYTQTMISISEERQFFIGNPTILRLKYSQNNDVTQTQSLNTSSLIWEQLINFGAFNFYLYSSYDLTRYPDAKESDTDGFTARGDFIFPTLWNLFNPILFASINQAKYINDDSRDTTNLVTYGLSLNRPVGKNWYITLNYSQGSQSAKLDSDIYEQKNMSLNLDYIY